MTVRLHRKPVFTPSQIERLSNIFDNAGQGFFVVLVLTPLAGFMRSKKGKEG